MNELATVIEHPSAAYLDVATAKENLNALKMRHNLLVDAMKEVLADGKDYGRIPGTGDKPTLLKPGAENLCFLFGLRPTFEVMDSIEDWDKGLFYFRYRCTLMGGDGRVVANSEGSCNSRETKYRYRTEKQTCPSCGADTISKSKYPPRNSPPGTPNGWWCRSCKTDYAHNDKSITDQKLGKVENTEPFELINTLQKMAQKRALVAAVLIGTGASQFFTQDVEDMSTIIIDAEVKEQPDVDFEATEPIATQGLPPQLDKKIYGLPPQLDKVVQDARKHEQDIDHWTQDAGKIKHFWAWCGKQGLDDQQVHDALKVEHLKDFTKTLGEAKTALSKL